MTKIEQFKIKLAERNLENFADPPDDPLGELSDFELGLRKFCYEWDSKVIFQVGETRFNVFLDPDICMLLEDRFNEQIRELEQGKTIRLDFAESYWLIIKLVPVGNEIKCYLREFGYSTEEKLVMLNRQEVLDELKRFLTELMDLAVNLGYISLEDKDEFIKPAFSKLQVV
ncbi:hypothetical protein [Limnofasciculus baicalensis]|uniref:Uncharacterized protein n=1 Tax=Limnofasciculus baicalensis BBK-W-15 TaxID=2699891 RepID=A0AAE3GVM7_9CYAN|nr:hypothetical protein [Limnofasciculus baicalensis]MCP2729412.1 hypothetical protein [Limnofasciculus baicalensis BBK-W-15]